LHNARKVLAFDFDGVILESVAIKDQAVFVLFQNATLEERRRVLELHRKTPGINRRDRITLLLTEGLGREAPQEVVGALLDRFAKLVWHGLMSCTEVRGIRDFLKTMADIPCYVVSASPEEELLVVAEQRNLSRYFVDLLGTPPPKSELLRLIMTREGVPAESILFIGDKISDFKAARNVGTHFIGRRCPENTTEFPDGVPVIDDFSTNGKNILESCFSNSINC
jgi:phosphoglycolate phosphatase-like HAD superfamily hydrolase